jgi:hypothetical protein
MGIVWYHDRRRLLHVCDDRLYVFEVPVGTVCVMNVMLSCVVGTLVTIIWRYPKF